MSVLAKHFTSGDMMYIRAKLVKINNSRPPSPHPAPKYVSKNADPSTVNYKKQLHTLAKVRGGGQKKKQYLLKLKG